MRELQSETIDAARLFARAPANAAMADTYVQSFFENLAYLRQSARQSDAKKTAKYLLRMLDAARQSGVDLRSAGVDETLVKTANDARSRPIQDPGQFAMASEAASEALIAPVLNRLSLLQDEKACKLAESISGLRL